MAEESSLAIKLKLELQDQQGKYLLYFPSPEPETEKDWLLDIKLIKDNRETIGIEAA